MKSRAKRQAAKVRIAGRAETRPRSGERSGDEIDGEVKAQVEVKVLVEIGVEVEEKTEAEVVERNGVWSGALAGVSSGCRCGVVRFGRRAPGTGVQSRAMSIPDREMRSAASAGLRPPPLARPENAPPAQLHSPGYRPLDSDFASDASSRSQKRVSWHLTERESAVRVCRLQVAVCRQAPVSKRQ